MSTDSCPSCGAPSAGTPFCSYCGKKLASAIDGISAWSEDPPITRTEAPVRGSLGKRTRRLLRSQSSRMIGGVCGGLGEFLGIDATFVRIAFALFTIASGAGLLIYAAMWVIVPSDKVTKVADEGKPGIPTLVVGLIILVTTSAIIAIINSNALPWVLIVGGAALIIYSKRARHENAAPPIPSVDVDLDAEAEAAWCRSFNMAMARKGDPARIHPGGTICPRCGLTTRRGTFCGHCGSKIEVSHQIPR